MAYACNEFPPINLSLPRKTVRTWTRYCVTFSELEVVLQLQFIFAAIKNLIKNWKSKQNRQQIEMIYYPPKLSLGMYQLPRYLGILQLQRDVQGNSQQAEACEHLMKASWYFILPYGIRLHLWYEHGQLFTNGSGTFQCIPNTWVLS